jgi:hypothetical protein
MLHEVRGLPCTVSVEAVQGFVIANFTGHLTLLFEGYGRLGATTTAQMILRPDLARELGELLLGACEVQEAG